MKKQMKKWMNSVMTIVLCAAMAGTCFYGYEPMEARAAGDVISLGQIERLKSAGGYFDILELVVNEECGAIGYYVDGYEPIANWMDKLATMVGPVNRKKYVDDLFISLKGKGIMGNIGAAADANPITQTAVYREYFPWEDGIPAGSKRVSLSAKELKTVPGKMVYQNDGTGAYSRTSTFEYVEDGSGDFVEHVHHYNHTFSQVPGNYYYYELQFEKITVNTETALADLEALKDVPLYQEANDGAGNVYYRYAGTLTDGGDFVLEAENHAGTLEYPYYKVTDISKPSPFYHEATGFVYYALRTANDPFVQKSVGEYGYWREIDTRYEYVGAGEGGYVLLEDAGFSVDIEYQYIYVVGGFRNNNWMLKYVFDMDDAEIAGTSLNIRVRSLALNALNAANLENRISEAEMLVLYAGMDNITPTIQNRDLTVAQRDAIVNAINNHTPIVVDSRLAKGAAYSAAMPYLSALCRGYMNVAPDVNYGGVVNNIYVFDSSVGGYPELATSKFITPLNNVIVSNYFSEVQYEIEYENFLRLNESRPVEEWLSEDISMATVLRSIINKRGRRVNNHKDTIKILDIEPNGVLSSGTLTKEMVKQWLPSHSFQDAHIYITTMSTYEFVGKVEDVTEEYDMIYIGDSLAGFEMDNVHHLTQYNDKNMNGLIYVNIGDTYTIPDPNHQLSGLIDRDYVEGAGNGEWIDGIWSQYLDYDESTKFRLSGNDITDVKRKQIENFVAGGHPVIIADALIEGGGAAKGERILSVDLTCSMDAGTLKLNAAVTSNTGDLDSLVLKYIWYKNDEYYMKTPGNYLHVNRYDYDINDTYYCEVVAGNVATAPVAVSNTLQLQAVEESGVIPPAGGVLLDGNYLAVGLERINMNAAGNGGGVAVRIPNSWDASKVTYVWTMADRNLDTMEYYNWVLHTNTTYKHDTLNNSNRRHICELTYQPDGGTPVTYITQSFVVHNAANREFVSLTDMDPWGKKTTVKRLYAVNVAAGTQALIPAVPVTYYYVDPDTVDNSSIMYTTLRNIVTKPNVMKATEASIQKALVLQYLNLSKPVIQFVANGKPQDYSGIGDLTNEEFANDTLRFEFKIDNPTEANPSITKYRVRLYLDLNGDGRYSVEEEVGDLDICRNGNRVAANDLRATVASNEYIYTVSRSFPLDNMVAVSWKLLVEKVSNANVHGSEIGYTYFKPSAPKEIKVLQVMSNTAVNLQTNDIYRGLYAEVATVYDINMTSITIGALNSNIDVNEDYLSTYDMVIMGFGDGYGRFDNLSKKAAIKVINYIDSGKAILFTHDNTSICNLPFADKYPTNKVVDGNRMLVRYDDNYFWGYYFNTLLRDYIGLDRYGVTDPYFGRTQYRLDLNDAPDLSTEVNEARRIVASRDYTVMSPSIQQRLKDAGYSIAYKPGSNFGSMVNDTQGFTNFELARYGYGNGELLTGGFQSMGGGIRDSNVATQTNEGQITHFPFVIPENLTLADSHHQYYQLNMNYDDIVVWYCLGGAQYANTRNDATNGYYIFNRRNVTYSGAGHAADTHSVIAGEAELFVNTMIAAYRAGETNPKITCMSASGVKQNAMLFPVQYNGANAELIDANPILYFEVEDGNLAADKEVTVEFYREDAGGVVDAELASWGLTSRISLISDMQMDMVKVADTNLPAGTSLSSKVMYKVDLPASVLNQIRTGNIEQKLYIKVITKIGPNRHVNYAELKLIKMGLLSIH